MCQETEDLGADMQREEKHPQQLQGMQAGPHSHFPVQAAHPSQTCQPPTECFRWPREALQ